MTTYEYPAGMEEMERQVVASALMGADFFARLAPHVEADDFFFVRYERLWRAMQRCVENHEPIDHITVMAKIESSESLRFDQAESEIDKLKAQALFTGNEPAYAMLIKREHTRRKLLEAARQMHTLAMNRDIALEEVLTEATTHLSNAGKSISDSTLTPIRAAVDEYFDDVGRKGSHYLPTGFTRLDEMIHGLPRGYVSVVGGASGQGKTAVMTAIGMNVAARKKDNGKPYRVYHAHLEMATRDILHRMIAAHTDVPVNTVRKLDAGSDAEKRAIWGAGQLSALDYWFDDDARLTWEKLQLRLMSLRPDIAIIDYLQLMHATGNHYSDHQRVTEIIGGLRTLAHELQCVMLVGSQFNREGIRRARADGDQPTKEDLKESGSIENDAGLIILLHQTQALREAGMVRLIVDKNRNGLEWYDDKWKQYPPMLEFQRPVTRMRCPGRALNWGSIGYRQH